MPSPGKRDIENENRRLRRALEDLYDQVAEFLGGEEEEELDDELRRRGDDS